MKRTVEAMGGSLTMIVTFPDQEPVVLVTAESAETKKKTPRNRSSVKAKTDTRKKREPQAGSRKVQA
jgi:hypothetical protein